MAGVTRNRRADLGRVIHNVNRRSIHPKEIQKTGSTVTPGARDRYFLRIFGIPVSEGLSLFIRVG
jgi:hypothetical protein